MKVTLSERAYQELKSKLVTMASGTFISARQFALEIGMSYTPVRDAFLRLQREGTLKQIPNVGFFVETMDYGDLIQSFQARECLELFVLDKVFERIKPEHIQKMRELNDEARAALIEKDMLKYMHSDMKLHEVIMDLYANKHLSGLYRNVREQYMICSNRIAKFYDSDALNEHLQFIDMMEATDKEHSILLLKAHIIKSEQRIKDGYINIG